MRKAEVINKTTSAIEGIWVSLCSLAKFVMKMALACTSSFGVTAVTVQQLMQLLHQAK